MSDSHGTGLVPGLSEEIVNRLRSELGDQAERVLRCLDTAAVLITQANEDAQRLRFAESAAYNVREALDSVVKGQVATPGGLRAVTEAWRKFTAERDLPEVDLVVAREELDQVLSSVAADESRASYSQRLLLTYLRDRAGIASAERGGDPVAEYGELRDRANRAVHNELGAAEVADLLARTVAWFVRLFTPPDQVVREIRALGAQRWRGREQIDELMRLVTDDHHLRLFFSVISDPAWLTPLHDAGLVLLPRSEGPWSVTGLLDGLGKSDPEAVAALLERLLADVATRPKTERATLRFELLRAAVQIGPSGHQVVAEIARLNGDLMYVRSLSVHAALGCDPTAPVVLEVADAVLNHFRRFSDGDSYHATELLDHLQKGVTVDNVADRARMLAGKTRRLARTDHGRYANLGLEALTVEPDDPPEPLLVFAHHLARLLSKARAWGVDTATQLAWLGGIPGEAGGRLRGHVLAGADDVTTIDKIEHVASRLTSSTATAEDLALVKDILARDPKLEDLAIWIDVLGTPSPAPARGEDPFPPDWARVWRWSVMLPENVLTDWREVIDKVSERHGPPTPQTLTRHERLPQWEDRWGQSPYSREHLSSLLPPQAAELVAAWEPDADSDWQMHGRLELARALADVVKAAPEAWAADPPGIAAALREPLYIEYYLRGLAEQPADITHHAATVLTTALTHLNNVRGPSHDHATPENQRTWLDTEEAVLDLARVLANKDADITAVLNDLWRIALDATHSAPGPKDNTSVRRDALNSAINRPWGHGLQTVFALAAWEYRNLQSIRPEFEHTLDRVTSASGTSGLELRALLASRRPLLEGIAKPWLDAHATALFRENPLARDTFDLTVQWAQPTLWLYQNFKHELLDAARRGNDNAARQIAIAILHEVDGYTPQLVTAQLSQHADALSTTINDVAFLVQDAPDPAHLTAAVRFWRLLLDTDQTRIPTQALTSLGRWAFVDSIDNDQWADLTARTLDATGGQIDNTISVADRAARIPPTSTTYGILLRLLDHGEPWERHHTATKAIDVLRTTQHVDNSFHRLRDRLIDLGYHKATDIDP